MNRLDTIINTPRRERYPRPHKHIECQDGATISVQANERAYCWPRDNHGPWTHVECGYPSVPPPTNWEEYAEDWSDPTSTVYAQVPVEVVRAFIELHGGEKEEAESR